MTGRETKSTETDQNGDLSCLSQACMRISEN